MRFAQKRAKRFVAIGTTSEGKWAPIVCPQFAQCLVCRGVISPGDSVMCSPGRWVRHDSCVWPGQARGLEKEHLSQVNRLPDIVINQGRN